MPIGDLNKRIELQSITYTDSAMSKDAVKTYSTEATVWAAIWPMSAKEQIQSMQNTMEISHRIRIRYRSDILPSWRIKFGSRYFNIISIVNPNERNEWQDIIAKEIV